MAVAVVTRHSPSRCLREIGRYAVILGERQHVALQASARGEKSCPPSPEGGSQQAAIAFARKAQMRLHKRYVRLLAHGKSRQAAIVAVARELCGLRLGGCAPGVGTER